MCHNRFNPKERKKISEAKNRYNQIVMLWNIYEVVRCSRMSQNVSQQSNNLKESSILKMSMSLYMNDRVTPNQMNKICNQKTHFVNIFIFLFLIKYFVSVFFFLRKRTFFWKVFKKTIFMH